MKKKKGIMVLIFFTFSLIITIFYFFLNDKEAKSTSLSVYEKIRLKKEIDYLIIGDSIGRGAGVDHRDSTWFNQWERLMKKKYGVRFSRHSIVQSGATAFEGLYLLDAVSKKEPADLIFIIFGENDRKYMNSNQFSYFYDSLLMQVKRTFPNAEIITITESCLNDEPFANKIKALSMKYRTNYIDMRVPFQHSKLTTKQLTKDLVHPNHRGYQLYADAIYDTLKSKIAHDKKDDHQNIPIPVPPLSFKEISKPNKIENGFIKKGMEYESSKQGSSISYSFTGNHLGVNVFVGKEQGYIDVWIDQKYIRTLSTNWPIQKHRVLYVESHLPSGEHEVTFVYSEKNLTMKTPPSIRISSIVVYQ